MPIAQAPASESAGILTRNPDRFVLVDDVAYSRAVAEETHEEIPGESLPYSRLDVVAVEPL
jgi:hypothetical protein